MRKPAKPKAKDTTAPPWVNRLGALSPAELDDLREAIAKDEGAAAEAVAAVRDHVGALAGADERAMQTAWLQGVEAAYVLSTLAPAGDHEVAPDPTPVQQAFLAGLRGRSLRASVAEALPLPGEPEGSALTRGLRGAARRMRRAKK